MVLQHGRQASPGDDRDFEWFPNERFVDKTKGDIEATFSWKFFPENGYTKIELEADYMPPKFFPKEELPFVMRRNEFEADLILENLKARFEICRSLLGEDPEGGRRPPSRCPETA